MSVTIQQTDPLLRRLAVVCCVIALLPITMGSLVTTLGAGMAFADWPSSDGQNMLLYPWLNDFRQHPDKFVEHGHRLAGMVIGVFSIALTVVAFRRDSRPWVRRYACVVLAAVIGQGLLGGARVILNRQVLAMSHSVTGALFFAICVMYAVLLGNRWSRLKVESDSALSAVSFGMIVGLPILVIGQYLLGGALRHLHTMLNEHIVGAVVVGTATFLSSLSLMRSESELLNRAGRLLFTAVLIQLLLGIGAYVTRLGFPFYGIVAVEGALQQVVSCTLHTVGGMFLLTTSIIASASAIRMFQFGRLHELRTDGSILIETRQDGGVA